MWFHKLLYDIDSPQTAFNALKDLALIHDQEELLSDAKYDAAGQLRKVALAMMAERDASERCPFSLDQVFSRLRAQLGLPCGESIRIPVDRED